MRMSTRARRAFATIAAAAILLTGTLLTAAPASAAPSPAPPRLAMAALGDSITQASMSCSALIICPANSWSTGTAVNSIASRLRALGVTQLTTHNVAVPGAGSSALPAEAKLAAALKVQYVTIEIGAVDACARNVGGMTSVATFQSNIRSALTALAGSGAKIFVASIPNLLTMYNVNKANPTARLAWALLSTCQSMLANPTSTKAADVQRRQDVQNRVAAYNSVLQSVCVTTPSCTYDGGAVAGAAFTAAHISTKDYFHPSVAGQALLADLTWGPALAGLTS